MGKRLENKRRKRLEIITNALRLFQERGYEQVSTADIATASHIAKKTFYQYFPTKDAVVFDREGALLAQLVAFLQTRPAPVWPAYVAWVRRWAQQDTHASVAHVLFANPELVRTTPALQTRLLVMWAGYERVLAQYLRRLDLCPDPVTAQLLAGRLVTVFRVAVDQNLAVTGVLDRLTQKTFPPVV